MLFPTFKKKIGVKKLNKFFPFFLISFRVYAISNIFVRWFLQIVDMDSENLYPIYPLFPCSDFLSQMWGGGECNVFLTFYAIFNISRKRNSGNIKNIWKY